MARLALLAPFVLWILVGCAPRLDTDAKFYVYHHLERQADIGRDSVLVHGEMSQAASFSTYGVRLNHASDDTGRQLFLRSYRFWAISETTQYYELELSAASVAAKTLQLDLDFVTRAGRQRIQRTLELRRDQTTLDLPNYFERARQAVPEDNKAKRRADEQSEQTTDEEPK